MSTLVLPDGTIDRDAVLERLRVLTTERQNVPVVWNEHKLDSGEVYFYNTIDGTSAWEKPEDLKTPGEIILSNFSWKEYKTPEGKVYFHNPTSNETVWEAPQILADVRSIIALFEAETSTAAPSTDDNVAGGAGDEDNASADGEPVTTTSENASRASRTPVGSSPVAIGSAATPVVAFPKEETPEKEEEVRVLDVFAISDINAIEKKDASEAFRRFLDEKNVPSNINWENCVKIIQSDKRFGVWKKFSDRKQAFNQYKIQKQKQEKEDQRKRLEKARENFEKMLATSDKVNCSMVYKDAEKVFATDKIWRAVPEREREGLFEDVMAAVEKREREQAEKDRGESMEKLANILFNISEITYRTTWYECQTLLAGSLPFVSDPIVKKISKLDALTVFKEHILKLEAEHEEDAKTEKRLRRRQHRKIREAYQVYLNDLSQKGIIHSTSKWKSVFPVIRNDQRFVNMQDQTGSTALDLFKLFVKDLQNRYNADMEKIVSILKEEKFVVSSTTEYPDFSNVIRLERHHDRFSTIEYMNLQPAFMALRTAAILEDKDREDEKRKLQEKEAKHKQALEDSFNTMLRDSKMSFTRDTKWISVMDRFSTKSAYQAIRDEEDRIRLFHAYIDKVLSVLEKDSKPSSSRKKSKKDKDREKDRERKSKDEERSRSPKKRIQRTPSGEPDEESSPRRISSSPKRSKKDVEEERDKSPPSYRRSKKDKEPSPKEESSPKRSRKKKRHHRSSDKGKDHEEADKDGKQRRKSDAVDMKADVLASELTEDELEKQRKLLMKQLGLMDA